MITQFSLSKIMDKRILIFWGGGDIVTMNFLYAISNLDKNTKRVIFFWDRIDLLVPINISIREDYEYTISYLFTIYLIDKIN